MMMKWLKKFLIYFPVILVSLQVVVNLYAIFDHASYVAWGFYLNTFLGTNVFFALFLIVFTFSFPFCSISRCAAVCELLFAVNYLIVQQDNLYNILFQITVGTVSLVLTYNHFRAKFPLCKVSMVHNFFGYVILTGSCNKALAKCERDLETTVKEMYYAGNLKNHR